MPVARSAAEEAFLLDLAMIFAHTFPRDIILHLHLETAFASGEENGVWPFTACLFRYTLPASRAGYPSMVRYLRAPAACRRVGMTVRRRSVPTAFSDIEYKSP